MFIKNIIPDKNSCNFLCQIVIIFCAIIIQLIRNQLLVSIFMKTMYTNYVQCLFIIMHDQFLDETVYLFIFTIQHKEITCIDQTLGIEQVK